MTKKRKKRKNILHSTFYRIYFAVVLVCLIAIVIGARWLSGLLADYESAQPSYVAEDAARLFEDGDYETIYDYDTSAAELADGNRAFYVDSLREVAAGKTVTWEAAYSPNDDEKRYAIDLDGEKFAEIALVPNGRTTKHGFRQWELGSVTTYVTLGEQEPVEVDVQEEVVLPEEPTGVRCTIRVPEGYAVTVDGSALDEANATPVNAVADGLLPPDVPNPVMDEYVFYSESGSPQIAVTDASGAAQTPVESGENSWACPLPENAELKAQYEGAVVEIAKKLAGCSAKTVSKGSMLRYCADGSPAYASISAFDDSTGANKKPESFQNIVTSNYYMYSDTCFSCHVSFDYLSKFTAQVVKTYPTTFTLYFVQQNGGRLYSFTLY